MNNWLPEPLETRLLMTRVIYVDDSAPAGGDGTSWATAYQDLNPVLSSAVAGDEIRVGQGIYKPGIVRTDTFKLKTGVAIYGGYAGYRADDPDARDVAQFSTVLSGDIGRLGDNSDNSLSVVTGSRTDKSAILDGLTIAGGKGASGGGMYNYNGSPTVRNCVFSGNIAPANGGGMYNDSSSPTLINCTFSGNQTAGGYSLGGGMYNRYSSPTLINCVFVANSSIQSGGAISNATSSSPQLVNCVFIGNSAGNNGGAIHNSGASPTLTNCTFSGNSAQNLGGAIWNDYSYPTLTNCTLVGNRAVNWGGAIENSSSSPKLTNCIVWGNTARFVAQIDDTSWVTYSDIQGGYTGTGNINVDPLFIRNPNPGLDSVWGTPDDDFGDLRLRRTSPAVDAGNNTAIPSGISTDLDGNARFFDVPTAADTGPGIAPIVDMGAYEVSRSIEAIAGGPYIVTEGMSLTLRGSGSSDQPGSLSYAWDLDEDGSFDDADVANPQFSAVSMHGPLTLDIALRVTDSSGASAVERTAINVFQAIYVDDTATGANTGASWTDAYTSLQAALSAATPGRTIYVAQGTYKPGSARTDTFTLKNGVAVYGGFAGDGAADPYARDSAAFPSILSGDIGNIGEKSDNSYHVVTGGATDSTTVLDGFAITGGNADGNSSDGSRGGGMYNSGGSPTVRNCIFSGNSAGDGGGLYSGTPLATLDNCIFINNSADNGGGLYNGGSGLTATDCSFIGNAADDGGGAYSGYTASLALTNCLFERNSAGFGAGICSDSGSLVLTNCDFNTNAASAGGGVLVGNYSSSTRDCRLTNCTFSGNSASTFGGAICNATAPKLVNCIIWANTAPEGPQIYSMGGVLSVTYSDIQGGYAGTGNIDADPLFVRNPGPGPDATWGTSDDVAGDLRLRPTSPAIDAGDSGASGLSGILADLAGNARRNDMAGVSDTGVGPVPVVDMGAYEARLERVAAISGPYAVLEGGSVVLQGWGSSDQSGEVSYEWDLDGDGLFDDATGPSPTFSAAGIQSPLSVSISLRVTDSSGASAIDSTTLTVRPLVVYVDDNAPGANDGTSWEDAFTNLQSALAGAIPDQIIHVAQGTYTPGVSRKDTFQLRSGAGLYGGYAGYSAADPDARDIARYATILSGEVGRIADNTDNSDHVVTGNYTDSSTVLDGFTITGGTRGGMYNSSASLTVRNCTFSGNSGSRGGGIWNSYSSLILIGCKFSGNSASRGGGVYDEFGSPILVNCAFINNSAGVEGGGFYNQSSSPTLANCTFISNSAVGQGGGICNNSYSLTLANCIVWGNSAPASPQIHAYAAPTVTYSIVQGGFTGTGNIDADPLFVRNPSAGPDGKWGTADDDYGDLRLRPTSPAIDAGSNAAVPASITTDLAGSQRFIDLPSIVDTGSGTAPIVDMGAYESLVPDLILVGTDGSEDFFLSMSDRSDIRIIAPLGAAYAYAPVALTSLTLTTGAGEDRLTIDFSNGSPIPAGGLSTDSEILVLKATRGTDTLAIGPTGIRLNSSAITATSLASLVLDGPGSLLTLSSLSLSGDSRLSLPDDSAKVLRLSTLSITDTATLDLAGGSLILQADSGSAPEMLATIIDLLTAGRIAGASTRPNMGLASMLNRSSQGSPLLGAFLGQSVDENSVLVRYTLNGDSDLNGRIDADDYFRLDQGFMRGLPGYVNGDFDYSGKITADDYALIDAAFGDQDRTMPSQPSQPLSAAVQPAPVSATTPAPFSQKSLLKLPSWSSPVTPSDSFFANDLAILA